MGDASPRQPPPPPELDRHIRFHRAQWVALPLLLAIPLLALLDFFGPAPRTVRAAMPQVLLEVEYPARTRAGRMDGIHIAISNTGATPIDTFTLAVDSAYLRAYREVAFVPPADASFRVPLSRLEPGDVHVVSISARPRGLGRRQGEVVLATPDSPPVRVLLSTFIFP
jgi:hypothetical protein